MFYEKLPEFTYHVIVRWPDGDILAMETKIDRETAFDMAEDAFLNGNDVIIECIERGQTGHCLGVSDCTAAWAAERDINLDRHEICEDCKREHCTCDDAYDEWRAERMAAE